MHSRMKFGQYIPADSILHTLDARTKIITTIVFLILIIIAKESYEIALITLLTLGLIKASNIKFSIYLESLRPFALLIFITVILQLILVKGTPVIELSWLTISREGLLMAISISIKLTLILIIIRALTATTSPAALMKGIEILLKPLRGLGLPVEELVMIMTISLRFIPLFIDEAKRIQLAQMSRGINFSQGSVTHRLRGLTSLLIPLLRLSINRATDIATAMEVRCYESGQERTSLYNFKFEKKDYLFILGLLIITIFILV